MVVSLIVQNLLPQIFDNVNDKESRVDVVGMDFIPASLDYSALENLSQMISTEDEVFFKIDLYVMFLNKLTISNQMIK